MDMFRYDKNILKNVVIKGEIDEYLLLAMRSTHRSKLRMILGETDTEVVLHRPDRLTQEEA
jgi:hypothetical protein